MKVFGWTLLSFGVCIFLAGFFVQTSVETSSSSSYLPERVVNLGGLQMQMIVIQSGLALFITGGIFAAIGALAERADRRSIESGVVDVDALKAALGGDNPVALFELVNRHAILTYQIKRADEAGYKFGEMSYYSLVDAIRAARDAAGQVA